MSGPAITKHLNVLERAGLISRGRLGRLRPCRLEPEALAPAAAWIERNRAEWNERLDRLEASLESTRPPKRRATPARPRKKTRAHGP